MSHDPSLSLLRYLLLIKFLFRFYNSFSLADGVDSKDNEDCDDQETPKAENNNSFFLNGKSEKTNGLADISVNVNVINSANLSLERSVKIAELDDSDVKKTKVHIIYYFLKICFYCK